MANTIIRGFENPQTWLGNYKRFVILEDNNWAIVKGSPKTIERIGEQLGAKMVELEGTFTNEQGESVTIKNGQIV